ncbi:MAG: MmgE/PrpD family protein [Pseudomonadota bacterium]
MRCQQFIHDLQWSDLPPSTQQMARRCLLDLMGVAASGTRTRLSQIIRDYAVQEHAASSPAARILFDGRACSATGAALANGMTIDSVDAHDGYKPVKGHAGCGVLPALLAVVDTAHGDSISEHELLTALVIGYEIACRAGGALHGSVSDYHTSGAWVALAAAAVSARLLRLNEQQTRHAMGIAEYHGPRSQMMRCIDHPTMLKDGSGWGSMAGVSAALLAKKGFTGAPAITIEANEVESYWRDLGSQWLIEQQYFKPYPVCRWAQSAVVAAMQLQTRHRFSASDIAGVRIGSFHESVRLATANPATTEEAQYSLPFPVAAALVTQQLTVNEIDHDGLNNTAIQSLSRTIELYEVDAYNAEFPARRISEVHITLHNGETLSSGPTEATGDPEIPLSDQDIAVKFIQFAAPVLGQPRAVALRDHVLQMGNATDLTLLNRYIYPSGNLQ